MHQLETVSAYALCVDLPAEIRATTDTAAAAWRIAASPSGGFVANGQLQFLGSVSTGQLAATSRLSRAATIEQATDTAGTAILLGPTGILTADSGLALASVGSIVAPRSIAVSGSTGDVYALAAGGQVERGQVTLGKIRFELTSVLDPLPGPTSIVGIVGG